MVPLACPLHNHNTSTMCQPWPYSKFFFWLLHWQSYYYCTLSISHEPTTYQYNLDSYMPHEVMALTCKWSWDRIFRCGWQDNFVWSRTCAIYYLKSLPFGYKPGMMMYLYSQEQRAFTCLRCLRPLHHDVVWIFYRPHVATKCPFQLHLVFTRIHNVFSRNFRIIAHHQTAAVSLSLNQQNCLHRNILTSLTIDS